MSAGFSSAGAIQISSFCPVPALAEYGILPDPSGIGPGVTHEILVG
nr:hypothetical protein [Xenorhabdus bovienii]